MGNQQQPLCDPKLGRQMDVYECIEIAERELDGKPSADARPRRTLTVAEVVDQRLKGNP
jgi:hypothetical protein